MEPTDTRPRGGYGAPPRPLYPVPPPAPPRPDPPRPRDAADSADAAETDIPVVLTRLIPDGEDGVSHWQLARMAPETCRILQDGGTVDKGAVALEGKAMPVYGHRQAIQFKEERKEAQRIARLLRVPCLLRYTTHEVLTHRATLAPAATATATKQEASA